jgi:hypothetical protein
MSLPLIYDAATNEALLKRINALNPSSQRLWGKMSVAQVLKHLIVPYQDIIDDKHQHSRMRWLGKLFFKPIMTNEKPYKKNSPTAKQFIITNEPDFETTRKELTEKMQEVHSRGANYFEGKEHLFIGKLTAKEWSNMLYKHLDHHLRQFGV